MSPTPTFTAPADRQNRNYFPLAGLRDPCIGHPLYPLFVLVHREGGRKLSRHRITGIVLKVNDATIDDQKHIVKRGQNPQLLEVDQLPR